MFILLEYANIPLVYIENAGKRLILSYFLSLTIA